MLTGSGTRETARSTAPPLPAPTAQRPPTDQPVPPPFTGKATP
jgi:hypothetical protein